MVMIVRHIAKAQKIKRGIDGTKRITFRVAGLDIAGNTHQNGDGVQRFCDGLCHGDYSRDVISVMRGGCGNRPAKPRAWLCQADRGKKRLGNRRPVHLRDVPKKELWRS
jgi:hypothetical protein